MRTRDSEATTGAPATTAKPNAESTSRVQKLRQACRQIFGIPDYERYLEHCARHHPDEKPLSRSEFFARSIDRKYGRSGPRCC